MSFLIPYIAGARAIAGAIPWQVWAIVAGVASFALCGLYFDARGYDRGRADLLLEIAEAEKAAARRNERAAAVAGEARAARAEDFEETQGALRGVIVAAEGQDRNALDALVEEM